MLVWRYAACAVAAASLSLPLSRSSADDATPMQRVRRAKLHTWLTEIGADVSTIEFRETKEKGAGVFMAAGMGSRLGSWPSRIAQLALPFRSTTIASFPDTLIINSTTILTDQVLGPVLGKHITAGTVTPDEALRLWLLVHRCLGTVSPYHEYIENLPSTFQTPLYFTQKELKKISGTSVHAAVEGTKARLGASWQRMQPVLQELQQAAGALQEDNSVRAHRSMTQLSEGDWLWAFSLVMSRSLELPVGPMQDGKPTLATCLLPGMDMINHDRFSRCWWKLVGSPGAGGKHVSVALQTHLWPPWAWPRAGQELTVSYGEDSNSALLFKYGFVEEFNPSDSALLVCPLGNQEDWDEVMVWRVQTLMARNLNPTIILPFDGKISKGNRRADIPTQAREVLEVLVSSPDDERKSATYASGPKQDQIHKLGVEMAVLTSFCRVLEVNLQDLEGPHGTGPLESDMALIEADDFDSQCERACVLYRAGQKRIVRGYLAVARQRVSEVSAKMRQLLGSQA